MMTSSGTPSRLPLLLAALLAVALSAARADASCPGGFPCTKIKASISGTTLRITDASSGDPAQGFAGNFVYVKAKQDEGMVYIAEIASGVGFPGSVVAGKGCMAGSFPEDTSGGNPEDAWHQDLLPAWDAKCPLAGLKRIDINVGRGDDFVNVVLSPIPVKVNGGAGDDVIEVWSCQYGSSQSPPPYFATTQLVGGLGSDYLYGGMGADRIAGQGGDDWIEGSCGEDRLLGGGGDDYIISDEAQSSCTESCPQVRDVVSCGGGAVDGLVPDPSDTYVAKQCEDISQ